MVFPVLSVTALGLVVGLVLGAARHDVLRGAVRSVVAAWLGFAVLGLVGLAIDVVLGTGTWLAWLGHLGALGYAFLSFRVGRPAHPEPAPGSPAGSPALR
jgi:hypothetical protein